VFVTAIETFLARSGKSRGRVCYRVDGLWVFVTEYLTEETEEFLPYWINSYPPSGLYRTRDDATAALRTVLGEMERIEGAGSVEINTDVGPYPEP
jgi:hypothetical protein